MTIYKVFGIRRYCTNCRYKTLLFPLKEKIYKTPVLPFEYNRCSGCGKKYEKIVSENKGETSASSCFCKSPYAENWGHVAAEEIRISSDFSWTAESPPICRQTRTASRMRSRASSRHSLSSRSGRSSSTFSSYMVLFFSLQSGEVSSNEGERHRHRHRQITSIGHRKG